jgi:murein DD-endopeptidase MepM/ murein hydrolase activator NlpD
VARQRPVVTKGSKRVSVPVVRRRGSVPGGALPAGDDDPAHEAKPFAVDPARPLGDQLMAIGVSRSDADAAARAVDSALKGTPLVIGNTGRAAMEDATGPAQRLRMLQIFGGGGVIVHVERTADGKFVPKASQVAGKGGQSSPSDGDRPQDDLRAWRPAEGQAPFVARSVRAATQSTVGLRRIAAKGDPNVALASAGVDRTTAQAAAQALAAVAPATLDRRSANIELVHGRAPDGQVRLLTATIYDRSSRGQVWWFSPKSQPEGFFDEHGNRVGDSGLILPIEGSHISSAFGVRRWGRWAAFHNGIDVAGRYGTPIVAAADGTVDYAGWYYNYGKTVRVLHSDSLATSYSHMSQFAPGIGPGTHVRKGQVIGYVGSTGRSTGPHLHFCVLVDGGFVNPAPYVTGGGGRLGPQDLVSFREWKRTTAGMARGNATNSAEGYGRL